MGKAQLGIDFEDLILILGLSWPLVNTEPCSISWELFHCGPRPFVDLYLQSRFVPPNLVVMKVASCPQSFLRSTKKDKMLLLSYLFQKGLHYFTEVLFFLP